MPLNYIKQPKNIKGPGFSFTWNPNFAKNMNNRIQAAQTAIDSEFFRYSMPYMPFRTGAFIEECQQANAKLAGSGQVLYVGPVASYLHNGVSRNQRLLKFNGAPIRGRNWIGKTIAFHRRDIVEAGQKAFDGALTSGGARPAGGTMASASRYAPPGHLAMTDERIESLLSPNSPKDRGGISLDYRE